jgi:hypothetical protein
MCTGIQVVLSVFIIVADIIAGKGYHMEIHTIETADKYLLKAWRLNKNPCNLKFPYPM